MRQISLPTPRLLLRYALQQIFVSGASPSGLFLLLFSPRNANTSAKKCDELTEVLHHEFVHLQRGTFFFFLTRECICSENSYTGSQDVCAQRIVHASTQVSGRAVGYFFQNAIKANSLNACRQKAKFPNPLCAIPDNIYPYDCNYFSNIYKEYIFHSS